MSDPRYHLSDVMTIERALRPANAHSWCLTDTATGRTKGIYARQELALEALQRLGAGLFVMSVLHPARCDCPEVAA